jgi:hypothetical protein
MYNSVLAAGSGSTIQVKLGLRGGKDSSSRVGYISTGVEATTSTTPSESQKYPGLLVFTSMEAARVLVKLLGSELDSLLLDPITSALPDHTTTSTQSMDALVMGRLSGVYVYGLHSQTFARRALPFITDKEFLQLQGERATRGKGSTEMTSQRTSVIDWESISRRLLFSFEHGECIGPLLAEAYCTLGVDAHDTC